MKTKKITRQYKWQLKKIKEGKCIICGQDVVIKKFCEEHRVKANKIAKKWRKKIKEGGGKHETK